MARNKYDVDEILEDKFDINQLKRLGGYITPYKKQMLVVLFLMLSSSALGMLIPRFFMSVMDICIPAADKRGIWIYAGYTTLIALYICVSLRIKIKLMTKVGQNIVHDIRYDIFVHLQKLPFSYYDERPHGKIQVRVVNYVNNLSDLLSNGIRFMQSVFYHFLYAQYQCEADGNLPLRSAGTGCGSCFPEEKAKKSMADPEQQAVQFKRLYCRKHQRYQSNPGFCPGRGKQRNIQPLK